MNYTRQVKPTGISTVSMTVGKHAFSLSPYPHTILVEGVGFEPTKASPADLQSAPVDRLGTPPDLSKPIILIYYTYAVNTPYKKNNMQTFLVIPAYRSDETDFSFCSIIMFLLAI